MDAVCPLFRRALVFAALFGSACGSSEVPPSTEASLQAAPLAQAAVSLAVYDNRDPAIRYAQVWQEQPCTAGTEATCSSDAMPSFGSLRATVITGAFAEVAVGAGLTAEYIGCVGPGGGAFKAVWVNAATGAQLLTLVESQSVRTNEALVRCNVSLLRAANPFPASTPVKLRIVRTSTSGAVALDTFVVSDAVDVPTNADATFRTRALYTLLLRQVTAPAALIGQQNASWSGHSGRFAAFDSDVHQALVADGVAGATHPALVGFSYQTYLEKGDEYRKRIIETDERHGVVTLHWPMPNFVKCPDLSCSDNDNIPGVDPIHLIANELPYEGRDVASEFDALIDGLAQFLKSLKDANGNHIPVLVRPLHEMNGPSPGVNAHWWAYAPQRPSQPEDEFKVVWQRMVNRLRANGVTNALVVFAPRGEFTQTPADYGVFWPEASSPALPQQRYVDVAAFDHYVKYSPIEEDKAVVLGAIDAAFAFANDSARGVPRVTAIAETGVKDGPTGVAYWATRQSTLPSLAELLDANGLAGWRKIAYVSTWTNSETATFSTFPGAPAVQRTDFDAWFTRGETLFLGEVGTF